MKTEVRLNSVVPHGVGSGSESGAMDLIYEFLLYEFGQGIYKRIGINQIGDDLKEFVMKEPGNKIHVNIRYPVYEDFETKSTAEKNRIRLDVIHTALLRVAEQDKKLDVAKLVAIKERILEKDFSFEFVCKIFTHAKNKSLATKITVFPKIDCFDYYILVEDNGKEKCKLLLYKGQTTTYYFNYFFKDIKWKSENELIITGKEKETEIHVIVNECKAEYINLTPYPNPPLFTMMRADITKEQREKAHRDWKHSLPPSQSAILDYEAN